MVSLGRVVSAPKPINLPSQRFEHDPTSSLMNDPSIKLVNRGPPSTTTTTTTGGGGYSSSLDNNGNNSNNANKNNIQNGEKEQHNLPERASWGKSWGSRDGNGDGELGNSWNNNRENNNYRNGGGSSNGSSYHQNGSFGGAGSKADTSDDWRRRDYNSQGGAPPPGPAPQWATKSNENNNTTTINGGSRVKPEIQHEVAGAIANLHIPQGDWGEDDQMDFSDPPPGGCQTTKARTRGSGSSMDGGESSDTRRNSNQRIPEAKNVKILQKPKKKEEKEVIFSSANLPESLRVLKRQPGEEKK